MPSNLRFTGGTDFTGEHRRLTDKMGADNFGILTWGQLKLPVVRLSTSKYVVLERPASSWDTVTAAEKVEIITMDRYTSLPEKSEQKRGSTDG